MCLRVEFGTGRKAPVKQSTNLREGKSLPSVTPCTPRLGPPHAQLADCAGAQVDGRGGRLRGAASNGGGEHQADAPVTAATRTVPLCTMQRSVANTASPRGV